MMDRLLFIVALLLALASVGAPALAYAQRGQETAVSAQPIAAGVCAMDQGTEMASYKPCGKRHGVATLCPDMPQLVPGQAVRGMPDASGLCARPGQEAALSQGSDDAPFRPPRAT